MKRTRSLANICCNTMLRELTKRISASLSGIPLRESPENAHWLIGLSCQRTKIVYCTEIRVFNLVTCRVWSN